VIVVHPDSQKEFEYLYSTKTQKISVTTLMNYLTFDPKSDKEIDGNFVSIYEESEDKHNYYVQRLIGVPIEDEKNPMNGKIWVLYVNGVKYLWNDVCINDVKVEKNDKILWRFQLAGEDIL
jgi:Domain of unknown function (DUF4430)